MSTIKKLKETTNNTARSEIEMILEQFHAIVYVCDLDSHEILYMNKEALRVYGNGVGKVCWKWFQPKGKMVCPFCSNNFLKENPGSIHVRDHFNAFNDKWYEVQEKLITWPDGRTVKLQIAYNIDHRKADEKKMVVLYKQQELFSKISTSFNQQDSFANKVNKVLALVGNFVDVSRVAIYKNSEGRPVANLVYEWNKNGVKPKIDQFQSFDYNGGHLLIKEAVEKKLLNANDLNDEFYREPLKTFRKFDVMAMLMVPTFLHGQHDGFIGLEDCENIRVWQQDEIELLKTFGNIISTSFERKRIEENRIRSEHRLRVANTTKDKFFSIITRDLLAPFSDLTSLSSILLQNYQKWDDEKRLKFLSSIKESSQSGYKLLDNLIIWSKMQSDSIDFFPQEVDARSAINLSIEQLKDRADAKGIKITGVPEDFYFVVADYLMLNTIVKNLLNNAIKFTRKDGEIEIKLKERKGFLEICICDNGIGIERQYLNNLFKIDLDNYCFGPLEEKGTGLGLIICREFVEKNGGEIWVESELGKGSCFKFTVPSTNRKIKIRESKNLGEEED